MSCRPLHVASFFSGCGGFDLGFRSVGFVPQAAYDCDSDAVANFRRNVSERVVRADLSYGIPDEARLRGIDALIAGPPCQGFSTVGRRQLDDERNSLLTLTGTLAVRVLPKVIVVENVAGAMAGDHSRYWETLNATLRLAGYRTHTICCQTSQLGMAQLRKRLLLVAWRTGRDARFPMPRLAPAVLRDALVDVAGLPNHRPRCLKRGSADWQIAASIRPGQKLSNVRGGSNAVATWDIPEVFGVVTENERTVLELLRRLRRQDRKRDHGDADPVSIVRLERALGVKFQRLLVSLIRKGFVRRSGEDVDLVGTFNGKYRRLSWDAPSCTVDTRFGEPRYFLHPGKPRGFTVREAARIQGFSDSYIFDGDEKTQYRLIGNAVPPPLGQLAATFAAHLLGRCI